MTDEQKAQIKAGLIQIETAGGTLFHKLTASDRTFILIALLIFFVAGKIL